MPERDEDGGTGAPAWRWIRSALGRLRHLPDRLLHGRRRRRALRRLEGRSPPRRVLVVCHGNICRSPYAEVSLRLRARGRLEVRSAGFVLPGRPSPAEAVQAAEERGVDLEPHRSEVVTRPLVTGADLVVVMEPGQAGEVRRRFGPGRILVLGDLDPEPVERRAIRDPVAQPVQVFREVYARIDRCLDGLVEAVGAAPGERRPGGDGDDVLRRPLDAEWPAGRTAEERTHHGGQDHGGGDASHREARPAGSPE